MVNLTDKKTRPLYKDPFVIIIIILAFLLLCRILFAINYRGVSIDGPSMNPTLSDGDFLYISVNAEPEHGDIVVVRKTDGTLIIKRVIATGGDSVYMQDGAVYIMYSGTDEYVLLEENYVAEENNYPVNENNVTYTTGQTEVPEGYIYVLGDNRADSADSRKYGCFSVDSVAGVVTSWSLKYKSFFTAIHF